MNLPDLNNWIEISESAYSHNLHFFKSQLVEKTEFSVVIKSNAYGHGMKVMADLAVKHGADSFCVHSLDEAIELRQQGITCDVLIMGPVLLNRLSEVIKQDLRLVVYNIEAIQHLKKITAEMKRPVRIHLKLETGTFRQGILEEDLDKFLSELKNSKLLKLEGIYTHFANIEDTTNHDYAYYQLDLLNKMAARIKNSGFPEIKCHAACSAAILLFPETHFDMVRLGISQYGLWPSRETFVSYKTKHTRKVEDLLQPVMGWKCKIGQIKTVRADQKVGYGGTFQTTRPSKIAILPVGYADGYDRGLSNQVYALIQGRRAPLRGRVCMNLIMVDITDIPGVRLEDTVTLMGVDGKERISCDYLASLCGTINYEFVSRINWQIPRLIVK
jgi:alanine racemase